MFEEQSSQKNMLTFKKKGPFVTIVQLLSPYPYYMRENFIKVYKINHTVPQSHIPQTYNEAGPPWIGSHSRYSQYNVLEAKPHPGLVQLRLWGRKVRQNMINF